MTESWILLTGLLLALHWGMLAIWEDMHPSFISIAMSYSVTPELVEHALKAGIVQQLLQEAVKKAGMLVAKAT
jgi:hypothetical protein